MTPFTRPRIFDAREAQYIILLAEMMDEGMLGSRVEATATRICGALNTLSKTRLRLSTRTVGELLDRMDCVPGRDYQRDLHILQEVLPAWKAAADEFLAANRRVQLPTQEPTE